MNSSSIMSHQRNYFARGQLTDHQLLVESIHIEDITGRKSQTWNATRHVHSIGCDLILLVQSLEPMPSKLTENFK